MGRKRRPMRNRDRPKRTKEEASTDGGTDGRQIRDDGRIVLRENEMFEKFYKVQNIVPEDEWSLFMETLRTDLPSSFRLVGHRRETEVLLRILRERYLSKMGEIVIDGVAVHPPQELSWYPGGLGFQMTLSRKVVRRQPLLAAFHNFLVTETEMGNVSRQETVSMIPPLFLDVQPHHKVFDMCAAPGSKTAQLIEMLHRDDGNGSIPSGFILANDSDNKRCYLLVHQSLKRLNSPCCLISNADATFIPNLQVPGANGKLNPVRFDRILCDVPCSGDGTLRKNLGIWREWSLYHAYNLHKIQFRIAKRGLELLTVGGIMVYSTCSMNPAEDEATVYRLLEFAGGAVELVDVNDKLVSLKRQPGLYTWTIMDKKGKIVSSYDDVPSSQQRQIPPGVFPPSESIAREVHLERCFRILPHHQDTGGFFVAVLRKVREIHPGKLFSGAVDHVGENLASETASSVGSEASKDADLCNGTEQAVLPPPEKKPKYSGFKEDPFVFLDEKDPWWTGFRNFFDVKNEFPRDQLLFRCNDKAKKRNIYFVNEAIKNILEHNATKIKFINAGLRLFARTDEKLEQFCYRLVQEGLKVVEPFIKSRVIRLSVEDDFVKVILSPNVPIVDLSLEVRPQFENLGEGSFVMVYQKPLDQQEFMLSAWRGKMSIAAYAAQENRVHILRMLGQDTTSIEEEMVRQRKTGTSQKDIEKTTTEATMSND